MAINSKEVMKVAIYFNLHKKCFSVKSLEGNTKGKVICHSNYILLKNVTFKVSQAGRNRVLREKRKNVHAFVIGETTESIENTERYSLDSEHVSTVQYNPYVAGHFCDSNGKEVQSCRYVYAFKVNNKPKLMCYN